MRPTVGAVFSATAAALRNGQKPERAFSAVDVPNCPTAVECPELVAQHGVHLYESARVDRITLTATPDCYCELAALLISNVLHNPVYSTRVHLTHPRSRLSAIEIPPPSRYPWSYFLDVRVAEFLYDQEHEDYRLGRDTESWLLPRFTVADEGGLSVWISPESEAKARQVRPLLWLHGTGVARARLAKVLLNAGQTMPFPSNYALELPMCGGGVAEDSAELELIVSSDAL